jgi:serine/threonine protein kinase
LVQLQASPESMTGPTARQDPSLPQVFGRYLLIQRLSRGGMGEIFLAKHGLAGFEKLAVIKKVLPHLSADAQFISRFVDEAQVAIKLQHVNVAQVFEVGRVGDEYFLALEYVEGRDLRRTLALLGHRKQRLPVDLALFIGRELANGLAYAHRRTGNDGALINLVHCDISPPNVLVSFEGETKVIDFGIAKSALRGTATDPKMGFGKFGYMAPEQLIRGGIVDHRTDIYAAGVVLYELLTGLRLYEAGPEPDYRALAKKVAKGEHPMPSESDPMLAIYDDLVATALRPKVEDRYQSAAEFRDAIQQCLVAVNPTISTDQLGAFMRELFAEEMTAQRELHERVAQAHLDDFKEQFHTSTISTISFAVAMLPLQAPDTRPPPRRTAPTMPPAVPNHAPVDLRPSPALYTQAPPTTMLDSSDLSLADGTGTVAARRLRRRVFVIATAAAVVLAAGIVFAMSRSGDPPVKGDPAAVVREGDDKPQAAVAKVDPPVKSEVNPDVRVEHIDHVDTDQIEMNPDPVGSAKAPPPHVVAAIHHDPHRQVHTNPPHVTVKEHNDGSAKPPVETITRESVGAKLTAARREYASYRDKYGDRLEREWNDLAAYIQYHADAYDDLAHRIDAFRIRMHE